MPRRVAAPGRLRRRLSIAFILVAAVSAGALAAGSFVLVRVARLRDATAASVQQARLNLEFASQNLPAEPQPQQVATLLDTLSGGGFETVIVADGRASRSSLRLGLEDVPGALRRLVAQRQLAYQRATVSGGPYLIVGAPLPDRPIELYFFFSEQSLRSTLSQLGLVLLGGWIVLVLLAAVVGVVLARRMLEPVGAASRAARSLAEGLLDTRLPVATNDEFGAWAASFNDMAEALEAKIAALSEAQARERRFTSDVAHELRTPLTALVSEASLLRDHLHRMPAEARRPAELLVEDVGRLRRLVDDLMEISRMDAGRADVRPEPVDVGALIAAALRARGWEGRVRLRGRSPVIETDRRRLERIVTNLVGNALEHGGRDVSVSVGEDRTAVFVEVLDRGPGIPREHLPHLFDRFFKADPSRTGTGTGLGLSIAMENARLLGGDIDVTSEVGVGSRFVLRLPVTQRLRRGDGDVSPRGEDEAQVRTMEGGDRV